MSFSIKSNINVVMAKSQRLIENKAAYYTERIGEELVQAVAPFDDTFLVPVYSKSTVRLSLSGDGIDKKLEEDTLLSRLLAEQEQAATDKLQIAAETILKEALKL